MEEEIFLAVDKDKVVKAAGIKVNCALQDLHIYANGQDLTNNLVLEEIRITFEPKEVTNSLEKKTGRKNKQLTSITHFFLSLLFGF